MHIITETCVTHIHYAAALSAAGYYGITLLKHHSLVCITIEIIYNLFYNNTLTYYNEISQLFSYTKNLRKRIASCVRVLDKLFTLVCCFYLSEFHTHTLKLKAPTWTQSQLQEAIQAVVTQQMRFTQASTHYGIPKGTLYDNILGKSKRMAVLDEAGLSSSEERAVLDFCCETSVSPYNRRTRKSLADILAFVEKLRRSRDPGFAFIGLTGFRWWWAFCKKHSIVSLYYEGSNKSKNSKVKSENTTDDES